MKQKINKGMFFLIAKCGVEEKNVKKQKKGLKSENML